MKIAEVVDDQKSADKNLKASQQEVKQIFMRFSTRCEPILKALKDALLKMRFVLKLRYLLLDYIEHLFKSTINAGKWEQRVKFPHCIFVLFAFYINNSCNVSIIYKMQKVKISINFPFSKIWNPVMFSVCWERYHLAWEWGFRNEVVHRSAEDKLGRSEIEKPTCWRQKASEWVNNCQSRQRRNRNQFRKKISKIWKRFDGRTPTVDWRKSKTVRNSEVGHFKFDLSQCFSGRRCEDRQRDGRDEGRLLRHPLHRRRTQEDQR